MKKLFTFANQLTFLRLGLIPFFVLAVLGRHFGWALGLLLAAAVSDFFDGLLARWLKQRSALGATLDPIADKLLLSTSFVVLAISGAIPWWITILVLSRDVLIFGVAMAMTIGAGFRRFSPTLYGKLCTGVQMVTVFAAVLVEVVPDERLAWVKLALLGLTVGLTVFSGFHYAYRTGKLISEAPPKP
jgi:cardiolipin synthase